MKAGIIGASGIGKHHAKWFSLAGCEVTAFTGTSEASCRHTAETLNNLMGFNGRSYTDYRDMLAGETLDIVGICSPPEAHLPQIRDALQAGLHVYCEKPVTWVSQEAVAFPLTPLPESSGPGPAHPALRTLLDDTRQALAPALEGRSVFGVNTQYTAAHQTYRTLYEKYRGPLQEIDRIDFILESKGLSGRYNSFEGIWIDMSSHALCQLIKWMPDGDIDPESIFCHIHEERSTARFKYNGADVEAILGKNVEAELRRQFGVNGFLVDYEGKADDQGNYRTFIYYKDETVILDDLVQMSINRFLEAIRDRSLSPYSDAAAALKNLEMSVQILERGERRKARGE